MMASKKAASRAPGQMSLSKFFCPGKPAEVSEQTGSEVKSDYDREVSDGELEGMLQLLLGHESDVRLGGGMLVDTHSEGNPGVSDEAIIASDTSVCDGDSHSSRNVMADDIGSIIKPTMTVDDICGAVKSLGKGQMYKLLTGQFVPEKSYSFPKVFSAGCNRCFQVKWLEKYPWLVYSASLNGGFCKYCTLFVKDKDRNRLGRLVNKPFEKWVKVTEILDGHASKSYHINAVSDGTAFIQSIKYPQKTIDVCLNTQLARI